MHDWIVCIVTIQLLMTSVRAHFVDSIQIQSRYMHFLHLGYLLEVADALVNHRLLINCHQLIVILTIKS